MVSTSQLTTFHAITLSPDFLAHSKTMAMSFLETILNQWSEY